MPLATNHISSLLKTSEFMVDRSCEVNMSWDLFRFIFISENRFIMYFKSNGWSFESSSSTMSVFPSVKAETINGISENSFFAPLDSLVRFSSVSVLFTMCLLSGDLTVMPCGRRLSVSFREVMLNIWL